MFFLVATSARADTCELQHIEEPFNLAQIKQSLGSDDSNVRHQALETLRLHSVGTTCELDAASSIMWSRKRAENERKEAEQVWWSIYGIMRKRPGYHPPPINHPIKNKDGKIVGEEL